ncbi:uncharacterized protein BDV14DRAFT_165784 [Aspergillus stella-maris]|uniref:uncharacterized protein n=1 Tax=Aspergillus stella-maris TaxID=1810926 RepID=UPI003CCDE497
MDLLNQRLTFACMWAFEEVGVQELENEFFHHIPQAECVCDYSSNDQVLVIRGKLDGLLDPISAMISSFIEKQENNDFLDSPRLRALDFLATVHDTSPTIGDSDAEQNEGLLSLSDESATMLLHPQSRVTKFWFSTTGGAGCFATNNFRDIRDEIANRTRTEIIVADDLKGLQVSGATENSVNDALAKLDLIQKPLSYLDYPNVSNIDVDRAQRGTRLRVKPYDMITMDAASRLLEVAGLGQMFVTLSYFFNEDTQLWEPQGNLVQPGSCASENKTSRILNDFVFRGIGVGDEFAEMEPEMVAYSVEMQSLTLRSEAGHPYLSPEKASQVKRWVHDGPKTEASGETEKSGDVVCSQTQLPVAVNPRLDGKKVPRIKMRRPAVPKPPMFDIAPSHTQHESKGVQSSNVPNQKRWVIPYQPGSSSPPNLQASPDKNKEFINDYNIPNTTVDQCSTITSKPYGNSKETEQATVLPHSALIPQTNAACKPFSKAVTTRPQIKQNTLVDIGTSVNNLSSSHLTFLFSTPALVPDQPSLSSGDCSLAGTGSGQSNTASDVLNTQSDGPGVSGTAHSDDSASDPGHLYDASSSSGVCPSQTAKLQNLTYAYKSLSDLMVSNATGRPRQRTGAYNKILERQIIGDLERGQRPETLASVDEVKSRKYHRTMGQKAGKQISKSKAKAAAKQATLNELWGEPKTRKPSALGSKSATTAEPARNRHSQRQQTAYVDEDVKRVFEVINPTLEAAEACPGNLTFDLQFGLIITPILPKTFRDGLMSRAEWSKLFQPRSGIAAPTTKFIDRLTVCGAELDHIVDLKTSKAQGKTRMFEQAPSERDISYELHCRVRTDKLLIIVIDEQGGYMIRNPKSVLGAVNMHFPGQVWDARAVVGVTLPYRSDSYPEFEEVAKYLVDHLWIPAERQIRMHMALPKGAKVAIEKAFVKRCARHPYVRADQPTSDLKGSESANILLQVTEVQDLFIGIKAQQSPDIQHVRARYSTSDDMVENGKVWYELSLVSSAVETILKANASLEVGERTKEWRSSDLFGDAAASLTGQPADSPKSSIAVAIGNTGIADMLQVAKAVVEKMDNVGACNRGPLSPCMQVAVVKPQANNGRSFDELESVKEVESVAVRVKPSPVDEKAAKQEEVEQAEKAYW